MSDEKYLAEIRQMQFDWLTRNAETHRWIIVAEPEGFTIHEHMIDGVAPPARKATKFEAAARLLQLMGIKEPVAPQDYPEQVCVGTIGAEDDET